MAESKKGIISEEALEEISGGLKLPKLTVKNVLLGAGIAISAIGATAIGGTIAHAMTPEVKDSKTKSDEVGESDDDAVMKSFRELFKEQES